MCVCLYIRGKLGLSIFHSSLCNTKDGDQPDMIAFNVSHKSLSCVCVCVNVFVFVCEESESCTHSQGHFKNP